MMLILRVPQSLAEDRTYAIDVVFREFLGVPYAVVREDRTDTSVEMSGDRRRISLADTFFAIASQYWMDERSLPRFPLDECVLPVTVASGVLNGGKVPILFGERLSTGDFLAFDGDNICLGLDVIGSTFFLLTRYEEIVYQDRDARGRFPAASSAAVRAGFIDRPLVNEYVELLWNCIVRLWPSLSRKTRSARVFITHDVDYPCCSYHVPAQETLKQAIGDVLHRRDWQTASRRLLELVRRPEEATEDCCFTFPFLMSTSEGSSASSSFNFIATNSQLRIDGHYSVDEPYVQQLMRCISERGHEIGYHASYTAADNPGTVRREFATLLSAAKFAGVAQSSWGGRHHYLRWTPSLWREWDTAGLDFDSSVGYSERAGFRCGTCYEFPTFDLMKHQALRLKERPLIAMDVTLLSRLYQGLTAEQTVATVSRLSTTCSQFNGDFVLLWHNDMVIGPSAQALYRDVISSLNC
jgi:hypothetical protein